MTNRPWTPRETEIVRLTADGLTAQQIARRLTLAPKTVENHIWRAKQKADCPNRAALVRYAITRGLIDPVPPPEPPTDPIRVVSPADDRADAALDLLIRHLDSDTVLDVEPVPPAADDAGEEPVPRRPRRALTVTAVVVATVAGAAAYGVSLIPDAPAAAPAVVTVTASAPTTTSPPTTTRKQRAPAVDTTLDELRTRAKHAARG